MREAKDMISVLRSGARTLCAASRPLSSSHLRLLCVAQLAPAAGPGTGSPLGTGDSSMQPARLLSSSSAHWLSEEHGRGGAEGNGSVDEGAPHFRQSSVKHPLSRHVAAILREERSYTLPHPIWNKEELEGVTITHTPPRNYVDRLAYFAVQTLRRVFDVFSGYSWGKMFGTLDEKKWLTRIIFLETVAGVPGMIAAMTRHLKSLRHLQRDHGWIHTLLEEAENERMHLLTALTLRNPGPLFKFAIIGAQGVFVTVFMLAYLISPRFCHRFVGYLEEEAVKTYTHCLQSIDGGKLPMWAQMAAPPIAVKYWQLTEEAMMRDVILVIRADEAHHRLVNHTLSSMDPKQDNPYKPGE